MLFSLAMIFLGGFVCAAVCDRIGLPRIVGMLLAGMIIGPHALGLFDASIRGVSADLRQAALIIILLKAGLSLDLARLKQVGRPALLMSFVPAGCEIVGFVFLAPILLGLSYIEAAVMGTVLAAVSPAVVVPKMVALTEEGYGVDKGIPQMILAGASMDDVFVIVLFTTCTRLAQGGRFSAISLFSIPVSIGLGILSGLILGIGLAKLFDRQRKRQQDMQGTRKGLILLACAFLLVSLENWLKGTVPISGLVGVMSMAVMVQRQTPQKVGQDLSQKFSKLWLAAEPILFVLVGAAVDISYTSAAGIGVVTLILLALVFRTAGVALCLIGTELSQKERLFCMIAYLPKATVQAAIGSVPLAMGLACGQMVLTVAVAAILITAPLGAIGMEYTYRKLLSKRQERKKARD